MKMSHKFLSLLLSTLVLSGCSTCPCSKKAESQAPLVEPVAVNAAPAPVVSAPAVEPVADEVPVSVRKYVNK